jgi:colanic acid/amylovoran biosynthesis glycosyltransferase
MNYLFINGRFPQYSQTFVHDQIKTIKDEGNNTVEVYARALAPFRFERSAPECAEDLLYGKPMNAKLALRLASGVMRHPIRAARLLSLYRRGKILHSTLMLGLQLKRKPDVSVTHFGNNFENAVELKKYLFKKMKNVVVFHGHDVSSYIKKNGWLNYEAAAPHIDSAICVNEIWAEEIRRNTSMRDVRTIYLGTTVMPLRRVRNGDRDTYSIVFVGRFVEKKGFDVLYQAVKALRVSLRRPFRVHCVGDGPSFKAFRQRAKAEGLHETFIFYGSRQKSFVLQLMRECDLLVAPSKVAEDGDSEGLPVVLMEAMMTGIPVLSTYHSGIPELIADKETGLLVAENDVKELADGISFAANHPDMMEEIATRAYFHVIEAHDEVKQVRKFTAALREAI